MSGTSSGAEPGVRSVTIERCQSCHSTRLERVLFLGYLPAVTDMPLVGQGLREGRSYPADVLVCADCTLVQMGVIIDPGVLYPPEYAYRSGATRSMRDDFAELHREATALVPLSATDLVVDVGSNDGTLLANFRDAGQRVQGVEPTGAAADATARGIPTLPHFFDSSLAERILREHGKARLVTATNVFAHVKGPHEFLRGVVPLLAEGGVFAIEVHYWLDLVRTVQWDAVYHEHLRCYTVESLQRLLAVESGLEIFHARRIPTHGGSLRAYVARKGERPIQESVSTLIAEERAALTPERLAEFRRGVTAAKLALLSLLQTLKAKGARIHGIGAPSRAVTLLHHVGLDEGILECVLEMPGSGRIGRLFPGTAIPIVDEERLYREQPEFALLFSWHLAADLMPKIKGAGFRGDFLLPLPVPRIVTSASV